MGESHGERSNGKTGGPGRGRTVDPFRVGTIPGVTVRGLRAQKRCPCPRLLNLDPFGLRGCGADRVKEGQSAMACEFTTWQAEHAFRKGNL